MAIEFKLPEVSEGVESADVAEIMVSVGDVVSAGQVVAEVETEKAVAEIECPHAGTVTKVHVSAGDSIPIGATLLTIDAEAAAPAEAPPADEPPPQEEPAPTAAPKQEAAPAATPTATPAPAEQASSATVDSPERPPAPAGPATRRMARDLGVDLYEVKGSGPGGRITQEDVQNYVKARLTGAASAPAGGQATGIAAPALPDFSPFGPTRREKLNKIGKTSAAHLQSSWNVIPHVTQFDLADITDIEHARKQFLNGPGKNGPKVTMTAIAIKASVTALKAFPKFNASLDPQTDEIVYKDYYHIGVAVDTPNGLVVPVVRDADKKSLLEIAADVTELAVKARDRKLGMADMQGGTFTITNLGGIGGTGFTPIVNYPEVGIMGMSRGRKEPKLADGKLVERLMLPLSLSYDHRVINGADAARFIVKLSSLLSDPFTLLSEC